VEADAVREQLMRHEVVGGLLADEPDLEKDALVRHRRHPFPGGPVPDGGGHTARAA
jgi:hypothetical protein